MTIRFLWYLYTVNSLSYLYLTWKVVFSITSDLITYHFVTCAVVILSNSNTSNVRRMLNITKKNKMKSSTCHVLLRQVFFQIWIIFQIESFINRVLHFDEVGTTFTYCRDCDYSSVNTIFVSSYLCDLLNSMKIRGRRTLWECQILFEYVVSSPD